MATPGSGESDSRCQRSIAKASLRSLHLSPGAGSLFAGRLALPILKRWFLAKYPETFLGRIARP